MRGMRFTGVVSVSAIVLAGGASAFAATAVMTLEQRVDGKQRPKLDGKRFEPSSLEIDTTTSDAFDPAAVPPKPSRMDFHFDRRDVRFAPGAVPGCEPVRIAATTTEGALEACGHALVGAGEAVASLPFGPGGTRTDLPAEVTVFNRSDARGMLLHTRATTLQTTVVLFGVLTNRSTLSVAIPPLGAGAGSSSVFDVVIEAGRYLQARCTDRKIVTRLEASFLDAADTFVDDAQACRRKRTGRR